MLYISHRGNLEGPQPERENEPSYIIEAIEEGFDVEIDIWRINELLFLGHDKPQYLIDIDFLLQYQDKLWIHCKNLDALTFLLKNYPSLHVFSHKSDPVILTSKQIPWVYPGAPLNCNCICVMPELIQSHLMLPPVAGVCSDYVILLK